LPSSAEKQSGSATARENAYRGYWRVFGGVWGLLRSTYLWVAVLLTATLPQLWLATDQDGKLRWPSVTLDVAPSLLGFALGGMAIMLAFSNGKFLEAIRQNGKDNSYLRKLMASFFHFSGVLTLGIIVAYVAEFYPHRYISAIGVFLSLYGLLLVMATVSRIWHTARIFNAVTEINDQDSRRPPEIRP
jgi:hypothetical protein